MASTSAVVSRTPTRQTALVAAWVAALVANAIHNDFGVDPAIAPSTALLAVYLWRPVRPLLWATAFFIALPSLLFLDPSALTQPDTGKLFFNHLALLFAGVLAIASVALSLRRHAG